MNEPREIDKCCQTLCNKHEVIEHIDEIEAQNAELTQLIAIFWNNHGPHEVASDTEAVECFREHYELDLYISQ